MIPHVDQHALTPILILLILQLLHADLHAVARPNDILLLHLRARRARDLLRDTPCDVADHGDDGDDDDEDDEGDDAGTHDGSVAFFRSFVRSVGRSLFLILCGGVGMLMGGFEICEGLSTITS